MNFRNRLMGASTVAIVVSLASAAPAFAQDAAPADGEQAAPEFGEQIVVTAAPGNKSKLNSSISVTDVSPELIASQAPRSDAEIFKLIPGIRAESTAGSGGNSNITVRGLPLASGGSKYVQIQEDGVPTVEYGDIAFGNNDYWTKYDWTVDRIQVVRGGSASTFASQAPGAVINYVSKTGETAGGQVGVTLGLGYDEKRIDFNYGSPITDSLRFNIGGFYRNGSGPRDIPYNAQDGYQIKANVTKDLGEGRGYLRLFFKRVDDRSPTYTQAPFGVKVSGNTITGYYALPGFDARKDTVFSKYNLTYPTIGSDGVVKTGSNREGIHVKSNSVGAQFHYELSDNITVDERFAYTENSGIFAAPFYGSVSQLRDILAGGASPYTVSANGTTYTAAFARYATGPQAGALVPVGTVVDQNPNLYTDMNDMGHVGNDIAITGKLPVGAGQITARAGWYYSRQTINMDWHWNMSVKTGLTDPVLVNLFAADGTRLSDNGLTGYNNQWGACCARNYDLTYVDNAPYASLNYADDHLDLDASIRHDSIDASGEFRGTSARYSLDVDGNGSLSVAEQNAYRASINPTQLIDYSLGYTSWSLGANYRLSNTLAIFARASKGYRANADRVVSGDYGALLAADGSIAAGGKTAIINPVSQQEIGVKNRGFLLGGSYGLNLTAFRSQATEFNYDLTKPSGQQISFQKYRTWGVELESQFRTGGFSLAANLVYTHSRIVQDLIGGNKGNTPRATPTWAWTVAPSYDFGMASIGFTMLGQTSTYTDDANGLKQKGQNIFSAFVAVRPVEGLEASVNVNNLFNAWDQAGRLDQGSVAGLASTGAVFGVPFAATNRVGLGRTWSASLKYSF